MSAAAAAAPAEALEAARLQFVLCLADTSLVLAQRLGAWVGHAPALEEDLALANLALDLLGQARLLLSYAAELEGAGRDEDALAFLRDAPEFRNVTLAEQPNGDFAHTIVRQWLIDGWQLEVYGALEHSSDARLAAIAAKALKETRYHYRFSSGWLERLGDGTVESHARAQAALEALWRFTAELFSADEMDMALAAAGVGGNLEALAPAWSARVDADLARATLRRPSPAMHPWHGKRGVHSEHLGHLLAEMQHLPRALPGLKW
ncbi:MAG: phenylacetate-CoA oxygenase subunit PaaC [Gammaproteobacteria bacterium]|nr:phenylacetate-CoA oxygenase subunit PaaC [Gammaproteobacteria bacterium]